MIIAYLTRDIDALKVCSLTCRSWRTLTAAHLYHTLTFGGSGPSTTYGKLKLLSKLHELGLMPFVSEIRVVQLWSTGGCISNFTKMLIVLESARLACFNM